jgi:hypothetical protein
MESDRQREGDSDRRLGAGEGNRGACEGVREGAREGVGVRARGAGDRDCERALLEPDRSARVELLFLGT